MKKEYLIILLILIVIIVSGCRETPPKTPTGNSALLGKAIYAVIKTQRSDVIESIKEIDKRIVDINQKINNLKSKKETTDIEEINNKIKEAIEKNETLCLESSNSVYFVENGNVKTYDNACEDENTLLRYYCENNEIKKQEVRCDYRCSDPEGCITVDVECEESGDGVIVIMNDEKQEFKNFCEKNYLIKFYCKDKNIDKEIIECESCEDNICKEKTPIVCKETDDGKNEFEVGVVECSDGTTLTDQCISDEVVLEYYIENDQIQKQEIKCNYGCKAGSCIKETLIPTPTVTPEKPATIPTQTPIVTPTIPSEPTTTPYSCLDSDDGINFEKQGYVTYGDNKFEDICVGNKLLEYYCKDNLVKVNEHQCDVCKDGKCVELEEFSYKFQEGWNMFSLPCKPDSNDVEVLFAPLLPLSAPIYTYDVLEEQYKIAEKLDPGKGYWILVDQDSEITILCKPIEKMNLHLVIGWNMIGSTKKPVTLSDYTLYTWNPQSKSYEVVDEIVPGGAYFIPVFSPTEIEVS